MSSEDTNHQRVRRAMPIIASATVAITLVTCVIITKVNDLYTGGLKWPYFSDMGRDSPGYYVFCVGLTIVAIALAFTWYFNWQFQSAMLRKPIEVGHLSVAVRRWAVVSTVLGIISVVGLPVLAFFSTTSYPSTHNYAAYWFFFLETIAVFVNTVVSYKIYKSSRVARNSTVFVPELPAGAINDGANDKSRRRDSLRRTFLIQAFTFSLFFVAFLLYLPIGLAVIKDFKHLTIQECLDRNLGQDYCTNQMRLNATETKLWNYEDDFSSSQMRSAAQLGCIITLVGYSISFITHNYASITDSDGRYTAPSSQSSQNVNPS